MVNLLSTLVKFHWLTQFTLQMKRNSKGKRVVWAIHEAESKGSGVVSLQGKMVDKPIVERAQRVIALAKAAGLLTGEDISNGRK